LYYFLCLLLFLQKFYKTTMKEVPDNETNIQNKVSLVVFFVFVFIGLPVWWKTTEVYRAVLPYNDIDELAEGKAIDILTNIILTSNLENVPVNIKKMLETDLNKILLEENIHRTNSYQIDFKYNLETDNKLSSRKDNLSSSPGEIMIDFHIRNQQNIQFEVSYDRKITIFLASFEDFEISACEKLSRLIKSEIINEQFLYDTIQQIVQKDNVKTRNSVRLEKMMKVSPKLDLLFSLVLTESEDQIIGWNIEKAIQKYLSSFLNLLKDVYDLNIGSQILFANPPFFKPQKFQDKESDEANTYVVKEQLSQIINRVESRLGSQISVNPTLNLVVHVVDKAHIPLKILKEDGQISKTNSFLVPRWGGMTLYNKLNNSDEMLNIDSLMPIFISHLRVLLAGLDNDIYLNVNDQNVQFLPPKNTGIALWELDHLYRLRCIENIATSIHSIKSLSTLLTNIKNIVINDNVAEEVFTAVKSIKASKNYLKSNKLLPALHEARAAYVSSDKAFFDSTLLELLYFPEDQKFAIYCPLFLPISITILVSFLNTIKRLKSKKVK